MPITAAQLLADESLLARLEESLLDFERLYRAKLDDFEVEIRAAEDFTPFGSEGAGGLYLEGEQSGHILYITSEGQAGIVAASLDEFIGLMASVPEWHDVLKFSAGGQLGEMQAAAELQLAHSEESEIDPDTIDGLRPFFQIPRADDAVAKLHIALTILDAGVSVVSQDSEVRLESLTGQYTSADLRRYYEKWAGASED